MGDENPIRTLGDYSKPSHEGYKNTIELPVGNNVVPLRSDTFRLVQNGCSFYGLRSEDLNQHLKNFLKLVDSLDLDGSNQQDPSLHGRILLLVSLFNSFHRKHGKYHGESLSEALTNRLVLEKALDDFDSHQEKRLSHLITQLEQQQDDMIEKINLLWKTVSENLNDAPIPGSVGDSMASENIASINHIEREELRRKGIKIPSKLFSPKYLPLASIIELAKNPSVSKRVHFVNSIIILIEESKDEQGETTTDITPKHGHNITKEAKDGVKEVIDEEENEVETDEEIEEILKDEEEDEDGEYFNSFPTMDELTHHEWLLKNPRPPWVKARIRVRSQNNIKISCMIEHFFKRYAYIDLESPINVMSRRKYNWIMTYGLGSRQKPSNPNKISNFVGRVRSLKIFIGSFAYECDFMILEDTTSIIDRHLREIAFGRPFMVETGLVYDREKGMVTFNRMTLSLITGYI
ncbi:MAK10-like protein [Tanacetum coccineum]